MNPFKIGLMVGIALISLSVAGGSFYTVDQGERAVITRNGAVSSTAQPGLGFKMPFIDSANIISVQEHNRVFGGNDGLDTYSRDQQPAKLRISVNYRIPADRVAEVYTLFEHEDNLVARVLDPKVTKAVKNVFGTYNAQTSIQDRAKLNMQMLEAVQAEMGSEPLTIVGLQVENIDFSEAYEQNIEQRMTAEVEVQKLRQNAEREKVQAEITVTQAKAKADATLAEAEAEAKAIRVKGEAEAFAIKARSDALQANPSIIALTQAERWNGVLPTTMLPGGAVPFLDVNK